MSGAEPALTLRPATLADAETLLRWRNDPETIRQSMSPWPVTPEQHQRWLREVLGGHEPVLLFIAQAGDHEIGTGRLDVLLDAVWLSVTIAPEHRGRGFATPVIRLLCEAAEARRVTTAYALVKPDNLRSLRAFARAGFTDLGTGTSVEGSPAVILRRLAPVASEDLV